MLNAREIAMEILIDINENQAFSNMAIRKAMPNNIDSKDESLIRELVYGVLENRMFIDDVIKKASKIRMKKIHPIILEILRLGIYQILFMNRIPSRAAVNESVNLAKKYGHKGTIGFVNGVLRSISRDKEGFLNLSDCNNVESISNRFSHPIYLVKKWVDDYGIDFTKKLCDANNQRPELNIRVNTLRLSKEELIHRLSSKGFKTKSSSYAKDCLVVENPHRITELDEYIKGYFTIQDESSILVGQIMDPKENSLVLDVCSAPGGKSTHLGQIMKNRGKIISRDFYEHKINLVSDNSKRLGIDIIDSQVYDALELDESLVGNVDYCLLDAPCSGFGLIRRKPEIKWNRKEEDIKELIKLQKSMLNVIKEYVKLGGTLVYSTCTIIKEENIDLIKEFLMDNPEFKLVSIEDKIENKDNLSTLNEGYIQLFPHIHQTDGFFIAKMMKV